MKRSGSRIGAVLAAVLDVIFAGLLWLLCSLPVLTLGAASAALYYSVVKCIRHERGDLTKSFFTAFRRDFRQSTLLWLILLAVEALFAAGIWAFGAMSGNGASLLGTVGKVLMVFPLALFPWLFAFVSRFSNTVGGTLKYCGYLALRHIGATLLMTLELGAFGLAVRLVPQIAPILPGFVCLLLSLHIEPVFKPLTADAVAEDGDAWYNE